MTGAWGEKALTPDSRGWGWMVKTYVANAQRPLYNQAKEKLLQDKQVTSVTISTFNPEQYCESRKHWDYIWFEMQHSTLSFNEVQRMIGACPGAGRRRSDDPHARCARSQHPEGDRPRRAGHRRSDRRRCARSA